MPDPVMAAVVLAGVFVISFMKGAFGGGFAIIGIPLLALVMDPIAAGALLAPLFIAMDLVALRYWKPSTWSAPDLKALLPGMVAGLGLGWLLLGVLDGDTVSVAMAVITLAFAGFWFAGGARVAARPRSVPLALAAGAGSGLTTMIAHAGGPPLAIYLLRRGLPKELYAGTTSVFFTFGNILKAAPWLLVAQPGREIWLMMALALPAIPLGVRAGWLLHGRLDQRRMFAACYLLLVVTALKLLWDGLT